METESNQTEVEASRPFRLNALIMDGGGVRGLSSLLILQRLMGFINVSLQAQGYNGTRVEPRDVFGFAAGTSTGGLIAIMLARLGMSIDECILEYQKLSEIIFKKKRIRGRLSGGLYRARYRGGRLRNCVRELLQKRGLQKDEPLVWNQTGGCSQEMHCSVVCREHENKSKFSDLLDDPVFLCSISCGHDFDCKICDAARATSAAWTYFPLTKIGRRFFSDGGVEYNNPSFTIWDHYTVDAEIRRHRNQYNHSTEPMPPIPTHPGVDFSHCRIVNIGTGSNVSGRTPPREREKFASLIPDWILFGMFLKRTLTKVATASDRVADQMRTEEKFRRGEFVFDRLSADNGVCWIKLDKYLHLDRITTLTHEWLEQIETQNYLTKLANDIAKEYLEAHPSTKIDDSEASIGAVNK